MSGARRNWGREFFRAGLILALASGLGLSVNALKPKPLAVLDPNGPGALPEEPRILPAQFADLIKSPKSVLILDVRNEESFRLGHAPQAIHAPEERFDDSYRDENLASLLRAADETVVLCDSAECPSADRIARILHELGHSHIRVLQDGWRGYLQTGLPVEPPGQTATNGSAPR